MSLDRTEIKIKTSRTWNEDHTGLKTLKNVIKTQKSLLQLSLLTWNLEWASLHSGAFNIQIAMHVQVGHCTEMPPGSAPTPERWPLSLPTCWAEMHLVTLRYELSWCTPCQRGAKAEGAGAPHKLASDNNRGALRCCFYTVSLCLSGAELQLIWKVQVSHFSSHWDVQDMSCW